MNRIIIHESGEAEWAKGLDPETPRPPKGFLFVCDGELPDGSTLEVFAEFRPVPTAREVAEALIEHFWPGFDSDWVAPGGPDSPAGLVRRWIEGGKP